MAKFNTQLLLTLFSLALMFSASACLDSSSSRDCDPQEDRNCFCTLDDDGVTDVTSECIDGRTDDNDRCSCDFGDPEPDQNPVPNPDPNPGPNPEPTPDPNPEPDPEPEPEPEPAPVLINQVGRVAWSWSGRDEGIVRSYFARSQPIAFSNLVAEPEPILALLDGRRLIGGDCIAYVEDDLTARRGGGTQAQPIPSQPHADIGNFTTFFLDPDGEDVFQITHRFDAEIQQYDFESIFESVDNPSPAAGNVRIFAQNRGPIHEESGNTPISIRVPDPVAWSLSGTAFELSATGEVPAMYFAFDMVGDDARAHVHCASQASDGVARFTVPDLTGLAAEIGWDESQEAPSSAFCGVTNISNPLRSGFYGVVEQALNGPEFMFEELNMIDCVFAE